VVSLDLKTIIGGATKLAERLGDEAYFAALCIRAGLFGPELPHKVAQLLLAFDRYGMIGGALSTAAIRAGDRAGVIDELGELSFSELDDRSNRLANAWREQGLEAGEGVTILARNHRFFLDAVFAGAKSGARIILLNTDFAAPQIREVAGREGTDLLVHDDEYANMLEGIDPPRGRYRAWTDGDGPPADDTLEALIQAADPGAPPKADTKPKITILTSGTTGSPKGAPRSEPKSLAPVGGLLSKVPFRAREITELCAPMFHALGFSGMILSVALGSTLVLRRKFDPKATLDSLERNHSTAMVVVPVMLQRILDLGDEAFEGRDFSSLRIIFVSGSALGPELAKRTMKRFGPVVYNLYGSTEIAYATIATPEDLEADPGTVGKIVRGAVVKVVGEDGKELPGGETGRIFVGNSIQFEGYTGGESKEQLEGLMSSGDVGHFDEHGRLFIDGRDDEMIVSGGENVFPAEVEELLAAHEAIEEAAAIGVEDEKFGQRLKAFVVLRDGAQLSEDEIKSYVRDNLARYKSPREVVFVDELPRNPTGKVLKRELAEGNHDSADGSEATAESEDGAKSTAESEDGAKSTTESEDGAGESEGSEELAESKRDSN
jgi:acyl-CoA synthetase (AMP-forming)/AMP-acid ligase II